jgi:hypothetical protein
MRRFAKPSIERDIKIIEIHNEYRYYKEGWKYKACTLCKTEKPKAIPFNCKYCDDDLKRQLFDKKEIP